MEEGNFRQTVESSVRDFSKRNIALLFWMVENREVEIVGRAAEVGAFMEDKGEKKENRDTSMKT